ncbi:serine hydrolase domain-containing protein [Marinigracilibium pacificum]|uniref:Beta-lactamase family protein n=1 Tax=Marinigracilibium pacificum TaxID=2729599 RepID=A0A848IW22_9BACT|nr:serine hydrolase domain-containing protein [Marinigracilibium pacificum]NMM47441.1 beta-lactamase family protein [Marinigracilibium pacificum]
MKKQLLITALLIVFSGQFLSGQTLHLDSLVSKIDALVPKQVNDTTPGLVVGISHNGKLIFSKGYGMANLAYKIPNDPKMVYNIGSVSKQFIGYAFAMLHVNGELNLDDPVSKYLNDWPEFDEKVTLKHVLTHTSGYREAYTISNLAGREIGIDRLSQEECLNVVRRQPALEFTPGSRHTYNSTGYVILAKVLENVTNTPADVWVEENILKPLNMNDTQIESYVGELINNSAESYSYIYNKGYLNHHSNRAIFGAADIYTNLEDLTKWINNYKTAEIGGPQVKELFFKSFILNDGNDSEYALGIRNSTYRGIKQIYHTGGHEAFSTQASYFPDYDLGIITISNFGGQGMVDVWEIADIILSDHLKDVNETSTVKNGKNNEKFAGLYLSSSKNRTIEFKESEGKLSTYNNDPLIPIDDNSYTLKGWSGKFNFQTTDNKTSLEINNMGVTTYQKVDPWSPKLQDLPEFEGKFWSDEIESSYSLEIKDDQLTVTHRWLEEVRLSPVTQDIFKSGGIYVQFIRNDKNEVSGLMVHTPRTINVYFEKL